MTDPMVDPDVSGQPVESPAPSEPVAHEPERRRPGTSDPRRSRRRALKVLFQADLRGQDASEAVADIAIDPDAVALLDDLDRDDQETPSGRDGLDDYARLLVDGVATNRHRLDEIIGRFSHRWEVGRMPVVDRNLLRLGVWELLFEGVAPAVVIDEAVELAKELSGDASHRFVNGILDSIRKEAIPLRTDLAEPDHEPGDEQGDESADEPGDATGDESADAQGDEAGGETPGEVMAPAGRWVDDAAGRASETPPDPGEGPGDEPAEHIATAAASVSDVRVDDTSDEPEPAVAPGPDREDVGHGSEPEEPDADGAQDARDAVAASEPVEVAKAGTAAGDAAATDDANQPSLFATDDRGVAEGRTD